MDWSATKLHGTLAHVARKGIGGEFWVAVERKKRKVKKKEGKKHGSGRKKGRGKKKGVGPNLIQNVKKKNSGFHKCSVVSSKYFLYKNTCSKSQN